MFIRLCNTENFSIVSLFPSIIWSHSIKIFVALLSLYEGNRTITGGFPSVIDGFPSQRVSNARLSCSLLMCAWTNGWANCGVEAPWCSFDFTATNKPLPQAMQTFMSCRLNTITLVNLCYGGYHANSNCALVWMYLRIKFFKKARLHLNSNRYRCVGLSSIWETEHQN